MVVKSALKLKSVLVLLTTSTVNGSQICLKFLFSFLELSRNSPPPVVGGLERQGPKTGRGCGVICSGGTGGGGVAVGISSKAVASRDYNH